MSTTDGVVRSLELAAEAGGDISAAIITRYHEQCPASAVLMDHMDEHMLGRMMDQVFLLMMDDSDAELDSYLTFETRNHESYGARPYMYENLLSATRDVVRSLAGADWSEELNAAWDARTSYLLDAIAKASASATA